MQNPEQRAIYLTMLGNVGMALLGIFFAIYTSSEAVLLDGLFSGINFAIALISLRVSHLIRQPDDDYYPFGYAIFEPVLNLGKGLIIGAVSVFAFVSAIETIFAGGSPVAAGAAVWYAAIAATGCMVLSVVQRRLAQRCNSPIVELDAQNWFIDGIISGAVALAFVIIALLEQTSFAWLVPYADPALVILIILATISIPFEIVRQNWLQITGATSNALKTQVESIVNATLAQVPHEDICLRQGQLGRLVYVQIYVLVDDEIDWKISRIDEMRATLYSALQESFPQLTADIIFTTNRIWIQRAVLPSSPQQASL